MADRLTNMGTNKMFHAPKSFAVSGMNLEARAGGAGSYAGKAAGQGAAKDIAASIAMYRNSKLGATQKDAASNAPGPKKV